MKRTAEQSLVRYTRVTECKKRTEAFERDIAAEEVRQKERLRMDEQDNLEEGRVSTTEEKTETSTMTALNLEEITQIILHCSLSQAIISPDSGV